MIPNTWITGRRYTRDQKRHIQCETCGLVHSINLDDVQLRQSTIAVNEWLRVHMATKHALGAATIDGCQEAS